MLLEVPTACIRSPDTLPAALAARLPDDMSVHGQLAADLALDGAGAASAYAPWNAVCPTPADLQTMPVHWPPALQALLPGPARMLLAEQQAKMARDWSAVSAACPDLLRAADEAIVTAAAADASDDDDYDCYAGLTGEERYRHAWLLVNTRTFYYDMSPRLRRRAREDRMVLQPLADLFNHTDDQDACAKAEFDAASFTVRAGPAGCARGREVFLCYGPHGGDALAVEYGFVLGGGNNPDDNNNNNKNNDNDHHDDDDKGQGQGRTAAHGPPAAPQRYNRWDEVGLDDVLLPRLSPAWQQRLGDVGFLGGYVLDAETVCYRTQVATRAALCSADGAGNGNGADTDDNNPRVDAWRRFVENGEDDDEDDGLNGPNGGPNGTSTQARVDALLASLLAAFRTTIADTVARARALDVGTPAQKALLIRRWEHVDRLVEMNMQRLNGWI